jgi:UDP-glucose 4-epimerase
MKVLVTGGAGYIGSVVTEKLISAGHQAVVYDDLSKGHRQAVVKDAEFVKGDVRNGTELRAVLVEQRIDAVIHLAADSLVGESMEQPAKYYSSNVFGGMVLLNALREAKVKRIVFSSTAAVYGEPEKQPIEETDPTAPTNAYGETKLTFERMLRWYEHAYEIRYAALRYFNAAGATERCGEHHSPETHLIPLVLQAAAGRREAIEIFGDDYPTRDGTCVRDYIHVADLARAHIRALSILDERSNIYNLGCGGEGYTVREVIETARAVTGREIEVKIAPRRSGDPAVLVASSEKIQRELDWQPEQQDLSEIISSAWKWMQKHPHGYEL